MSVDQSTAASTRRRDRLITVGAATLTALVVWVSAVLLLDVALTISRGGEASKLDEVGVIPVLLTSLFAGLAGWGLLALLEKFTARARTAWTIIASIVLLVSLIGPFNSGTTTSAKVALLSMHLAVGGVIIVLLRRSSAAS